MQKQPFIFLFFFFQGKCLLQWICHLFPCQPRLLIVQDLTYVSQAKQAFHRYLGVSWVKSVQDETELWCDVSSVLHRLDVGRKWCVVQAEEEKRETWGVEWVNVCTLFDVSADLEHSCGWIPWLLISDLSTGFCKCAKGINSVYGSASESSAAILLSLEGWDTVHLYLSCYFWLSIIWGH